MAVAVAALANNNNDNNKGVVPAHAKLHVMAGDGCVLCGMCVRARRLLHTHLRLHPPCAPAPSLPAGALLVNKGLWVPGKA